jgi:hypothetical protein
MYTPYPEPEYNILARHEYPKMPVNELMAIYEKLTAYGLYVMPKQMDKKVPVV